MSEHLTMPGPRTETKLAPFRTITVKEIRRAWKSVGMPPVCAYQSSEFLAAIYVDNGHHRLSINRVKPSKERPGTWVDGITWDEIQAIKSAIGLGSQWAVEIYPPDGQVVDVANLRHLWLLPESPPYGWRKE